MEKFFNQCIRFLVLSYIYHTCLWEQRWDKVRTTSPDGFSILKKVPTIFRKEKKKKSFLKDCWNKNENKKTQEKNEWLQNKQEES